MTKILDIQDNVIFVDFGEDITDGITLDEQLTEILIDSLQQMREQFRSFYV